MVPLSTDRQESAAPNTIIDRDKGQVVLLSTIRDMGQVVLLSTDRDTGSGGTLEY